MRDPATDPRRQRGVGGPYRLHQTLAENFVAGDDRHPRGELLASDRGRLDLDLDVVVALLVAPCTQRVFAALISGVDAPLQ